MAGPLAAAGPAAGVAAASVKKEKAEPVLGAAGAMPPHGAQPAGVKAEAQRPGHVCPGLGSVPSQPASGTPAPSGAAGAASGEPGMSPDPNLSSEQAPGSASQEADVGDAEDEGGVWTGWSGWTGEDGE